MLKLRQIRLVDRQLDRTSRCRHDLCLIPRIKKPGQSYKASPRQMNPRTIEQASWNRWSSQGNRSWRRRPRSARFAGHTQRTVGRRTKSAIGREVERLPAFEESENAFWALDGQSVVLRDRIRFRPEAFRTTD